VIDLEDGSQITVIPGRLAALFALVAQYTEMCRLKISLNWEVALLF
jgi:hypothetical protein